MATRTIARLFDDSSTAQAAVNELEGAGFARDDISYVAGQGTSANDTTRTTTTRGDTGADTGAGTGATLGTVLGGGAGLLAGLGALAIPGIGPIVAAGWLVATLTGAGVGAAAGGLLGGLAGAGFGEEDAATYSEGIRRGGHLVVVRVADDTRAAEAERILDRHGPVDMDRRTSEWRDAGWTGPGAGTTATGTAAGTAGALGGGMAAPGLNDDVTSANDPTRRRPGDVA
ncbi:hypothetical protein [Falsiroseomonas sp. HW251]|uniref:hypothetical protein n=1 Tax=Falsiroseomonas sp. HW251 TaxID=3390998 RepID=UPI003D3136C4